MYTVVLKVAIISKHLLLHFYYLFITRNMNANINSYLLFLAKWLFTTNKNFINYSSACV